MKTPVEKHFNPIYHVPLNVYTVPLVLWDVLENSFGTERCEFTQDYPINKNIPKPKIVWKVYRRIPGKEGLETRKPRPRTEELSSARDGTYIDVWGQWHTIIYQFDIYATDNDTANNLLVDFEELMFQVTGLLKSVGVIDWVFDEQLVDFETPGQNIQGLCRRTLRYRCVIDKKYKRLLPSFKSIWIQPVSGDTPVCNKKITRSTTPGQVYDVIPNTWVSSIGLVTNSPVESKSTESDYIENVDFTLDVDFKTGESRIYWTTDAKHPLPGVEYYISYTYSNPGLSTEVF